MERVERSPQPATNRTRQNLKVSMSEEKLLCQQKAYKLFSYEVEGRAKGSFWHPGFEHWLVLYNTGKGFVFIME